MAIALAAVASSSPLAARAATQDLAEGRYAPSADAVRSAVSDSPQNDSPKLSPGSDPNGAIEQWKKQVGPTYIAHEQALDSVDTWINDRPSLHDSGYVGVIEDAHTFSITLLWHGSDSLLASARTYAESTGADVTVEQRPYSQSELSAATATLWASRPVSAASGFELTEVVQVSGDAPLPIVHGVLSSFTAASTVLDSIEDLTGVRYILGDVRVHEGVDGVRQL